MLDQKLITIGVGALMSISAGTMNEQELINTTAADYGVYGGILIGLIGVVAKVYDSYENRKHLKSIQRLKSRELDILESQGNPPPVD